MKHEAQLAYNSGGTRGSLMPILAITLLGIFFVVAIFNTFVSSRGYETDIIERDLKKLAEIFEKIDGQCGILGFDYQKNVINFLNVRSFDGSEVGSMNLKHADKWQGPYVREAPRIQGREYLIVRTKKGYFITPGEHVKLPNGKKVGDDIKLDLDADIAAMMKDEASLCFKGKALAIPVAIGTPPQTTVSIATDIP